MGRIAVVSSYPLSVLLLMVRIYLLSDLHANYPQNWKWLSEISNHTEDVLVYNFIIEIVFQ